MDKARFSQGVQFLAEAGLNLLAVLDCAELPAGVATTMTAAWLASHPPELRQRT